MCDWRYGNLPCSENAKSEESSLCFIPTALLAVTKVCDSLWFSSVKTRFQYHVVKQTTRHAFPMFQYVQKSKCDVPVKVPF